MFLIYSSDGSSEEFEGTGSV